METTVTITPIIIGDKYELILEEWQLKEINAALNGTYNRRNSANKWRETKHGAKPIPRHPRIIIGDALFQDEVPLKRSPKIVIKDLITTETPLPSGWLDI